MKPKFTEHCRLVLDPFLKAAKHLRAEDKIAAAFGACVTHHKTPGILVGLIEKRFIRVGRPFFNVYPAVLSALMKTSMSIRPDSIPESVVHELMTIAVKFPIGGDLHKSIKMQSILISIIKEEQIKNLKVLGLQDVFGTHGKPFVVVTGAQDDGSGIALATCPLDSTFEDAAFAVNMLDEQKRISHQMCRIALGVMLLAADPDYVKPVILKADEGKTTPIDERVERARNRGVFGFTLGEDIEVSPHFRRPHFAIRWTGKGASVPKLVPVKGAVIGRSIMTTVPTGYEDEISKDMVKQ